MVENAAGEANNEAAATITTTLADYPDLAVTGITAPASAAAGETVTITYTVRNLGAAAAQGAWTERLLLSADAALGGDQLLATVPVSGQSLAAGASVTRSVTVTLPSFVEGAQRIIAETDAGNAVFESNEANNVTVDDAAIALARALSFTVLPTTISEEAGAAAARGQVSRTGSTLDAVTVSLGANRGELILPATVVIPAGQSTATFVVGVTGNGLVDGTRTATLTAGASGFASATTALAITDDDVARLTVTLPSATVTEGAATFRGTVTRNGDTTGPLTVALALDKSYKATLPATVTIAAGERSADFDVQLVDDLLVEGTRNLRFTATAAGYVTGSAETTEYDDDVPSLSLRLGQTAVAENGGVATTVTVTRNLVSDQPIEVLLRADAGEIRLPSRLVIAGGQASATAQIQINDNDVVDGARIVVIRADVADAVLGVSIRRRRSRPG